MLQGPTHGQVSVLPGTSTCHQPGLVGHAKLTQRVEVGMGAAKARGWLEEGHWWGSWVSTHSPASILGQGGPGLPGSKVGREPPGRGSTGSRGHWAQREARSAELPALPIWNICLPPQVWILKAWV